MKFSVSSSELNKGLSTVIGAVPNKATLPILETILLGMAMNVNPYDQPAVELIKKETKKILI